jgi:two-component system LytT family response regulator
MKVLIVDDEPLARERIRTMLQPFDEVSSVAEAANGGEAIKALRKEIPDVVFLDIQMPDISGLQVLEKLGPVVVAQIPALIFVTAYEQHALRAFEHHALDYLLKPFDRDRFGEAFKRAKAQMLDQNGSSRRILTLLEQLSSQDKYVEWLTIKKDERILLLKVEDIHWIEAKGNYVLLKFKENAQMMRETINNISGQLDPKIFMRIHRSTIVNVNQIKELQVWARGEYRVVMKTGQTFTLSRGYRDKFDAFLKRRALQ